MAESSFAQRWQRFTRADRRRSVALERKSSPVIAAIVETGTAQARWTTMDYTSMSREGYARNPYVYKAIDQNAKSFAGIKWRLYTDEQKKKELVEHPLLDLWRRPNPLQGGSTFRAMFLAYLLLDGNSFIHALAPSNGAPAEMYCLRPDRVTILPGNAANPIAGYQYAVGNQKVKIPAEQVRHFKLFNPLDDWRGLSPMAAAAQSIDQSNAAKSWNVALLQNGARTTGVITTQYTLDDEQYQRLKEDIAQEYGGFLNAGRPILLEGGATWQEAGMTPAEMHWTEGQKLNAREIALCFNIAPELIGDASNKTYSNYSEARRALYEENILPTCDVFREDINPWLQEMFGDQIFMDYDINDIEALQEDQDATEGRATRRFNAGYMKVNEARVATGLEEDNDSEWGDKYIFELPQRSPAQPDKPEEPAGLPGAQPGAALPAGQQHPGLPAPDDNTEPGTPPDPGDPHATTDPTKTGDAATGKGGPDAGTKRVLPFARGPLSIRRGTTYTVSSQTLRSDGTQR